MNSELFIEAFILCYNEEKLIRHTLNHYGNICKKITVIDNCSTDKTLDIITIEYPKVIIKQFDTHDQIRDDAYLHIKNSVWKESKADFVIVCDMDELLYHPNLYEELKKAKQNGVAMFTTKGYNMVAEYFPENYNIPITEQVKTGVRAFNFDKKIIFSPHFVQNILYAPGAHTCNPIFYPNAPKNVHPEPLKLLHYKYLGREYLKERHNMYAARLSDYNKRNLFGGEYLKGDQHVNECFNLIKQTKLLTVIQ